MQDSATPTLVSEAESPLEEFSVPTADGARAIGVLRRPPGSGPFPAVVMLHGGLDPLPREVLALLARQGFTMNRFLASGYAVVLPTRRARPDHEQGAGAFRDTLAVIASVRARPEIDAEGVALFGSSGGADLALEVAGEARPVAIVAEEPATSLLAGILDSDTPKSAGTWLPADVWPADPRLHYTAARQRRTRDKLARIRCPVLVTQGDQKLPGGDQLRMINDILIPELLALGKHVVERVYPGQSHGFAFVAGAAPEPLSDETAVAARRLFEDAEGFIRAHLPRATGRRD